MKALIRLAMPVAISHLANMALQVVDMFFVGKLGPVAVGGVGVGSAVFVTIMVVGIGLILGLDYLVSHAFGAGKIQEAHEDLVQALMYVTLISIPLMMGLWAMSSQIGILGVRPEIAEAAQPYLKQLTWSLWPFLLYCCVRQYLQALGIATPVTIVMIFANLLNAFGNWVWIQGHLGFEAHGILGSAYATTVARLFMFFSLTGYVFWKEWRKPTGLFQVSLKPCIKKWKKLFKLGFPAAVQMLFEVGVFALSTVLVGRMDAHSLAAHSIVLQAASVTFMLPLGVSAAGAVLVGQALGRKDRPGAIQMGWRAFELGAGLMVVMGVLLALFGVTVVAFFNADPEVLHVASKLLIAAACFQLFDGIQVVGTGVLRGWGDTVSPMISNLVGHWAIGLPLSLYLGFSRGLGALGVWVGLSLGLVFVGITLLLRWRYLSRHLPV